MKKQQIFFIIIFTILSLLAFQVPISKIIGSNQSFTLFELVAPVGGMFLGPLFGGLSAFLVRFVNVVFTGQNFDLLTIIRFFPAVLGAIYFGMKTKKTALIFPLCIVLFLLNPIGRQAWLYPMIWLVPFVATFFKKRLILNSLGATFTAHAVGSTIVLYAFGLTPAIWMALIPVVFIERGVFAIGIWLSFMTFNIILDRLSQISFAKNLSQFVNKDYILPVKFLKFRS